MSLGNSQGRKTEGAFRQEGSLPDGCLRVPESTGKGHQTLRRTGDRRSRKNYERGCLSIKIGGMRGDLGISLCLLSVGVKGVMK